MLSFNEGRAMRNVSSLICGQRRHPRILIRAFSVRLQNHWILQNVSMACKGPGDSLCMRRMFWICAFLCTIMLLIGALFQLLTQNMNIFLISAQKICCGYSLEAPLRGAFNDYIQRIFLCKKIRKIFILTLSTAVLPIAISFYIMINKKEFGYFAH